MKIITFNRWHGLSGGGLYRFGELEPPHRQHQRTEWQYQLFNEHRPDIVLLQELNPVSAMAHGFATRLGLKEVHAVDNSGIKLLGRGIPNNLQTGLAILYKSPWELERSWSIQLSGNPLSFNSDLASLQWSENRIALFAKIHHPDQGPFLVINAHLHHGFQLQASLEQQVDRWLREKRIGLAEWRRVLGVLRRGEERRRKEVTRLIREAELCELGCRAILLGGDFNGTMESVVYKKLIQAQFTDLWLERHQDHEGLTWDRTRNAQNHDYLKDFVSDIEMKSFKLRPNTMQPLKFLIDEMAASPKRLDYLWAKAPYEKISLKSIQLFADQPGPNAIMASDHFGVAAEIKWNYLT